MKEKAQNKGGRPKIKEEDKRRHRVTLSLTDKELKTASGCAHLTGKKLTEWIRITALDAPLKIVPAVNKKVWHNLARLGGNLNQLMFGINSGEIKGFDPEIVNELIQEIKRTKSLFYGE
jgi:hypothetical protein